MKEPSYPPLVVEQRARSVPRREQEFDRLLEENEHLRNLLGNMQT